MSIKHQKPHSYKTDGLAAFRAFLKTEFSEENLEFWLACEDFKKTRSAAKLAAKAQRIFEEFIDVQAPREVNIDFQTRELTRRNVQEPSLSCFDQAQGKVHSLMEKDSAKDLKTRLGILLHKPGLGHGTSSKLQLGSRQRGGSAGLVPAEKGSSEHSLENLLASAMELRSGEPSGTVKEREKGKRAHRDSSQEVLEWRESFDQLLKSKSGVNAFHTFLKTEFSEENLDFWLACEDFKKTRSKTKLASKANRIFEEFVQSEAPREVNIDHETREITRKNLSGATSACFNEAQAKTRTLMEKDSYPRFLKSASYQDMTKQATSRGTNLGGKIYLADFDNKRKLTEGQEELVNSDLETLSRLMLYILAGGVKPLQQVQIEDLDAKSLDYVEALNLMMNEAWKTDKPIDPN
ncbi:hypothetical protein BTVI_109144 [Pitangus sulphuratus]|nr:hypothetical protein BTVI_109144 [Pitangus sulphuratus]